MGTVNITSPDPQTTLPPAYTFRPSDMGSHTFTVTARTAGAELVTATDNRVSSVKGVGFVLVQPAAAVRLSVLGLVASPVAGTPTTYFAMAMDAFGNRASGYQGVVQVSASDKQAVLPSSVTFAKSDGGVKLFTVAYHTAGVQTLSLSDGTAHISGAATASVQ